MTLTKNHWTFTDGTTLPDGTTRSESSTLPIGTMYCIGRNYAAHTREMNAEVSQKPLVFLKPPNAFVRSGGVVALPTWSDNIHHEVELVVVMGANGIAGLGVGLDLTARDVQSVAKKRGEPWAVAKGWRGSAPISDIVPISTVGSGPWEIELAINGEQRQHGSTADMERTIEELIAYIDDVFSLREGDCIFTGTPEGVARCVAGDVAVAQLRTSSSDVLASLHLSFV